MLSEAERYESLRHCKCAERLACFTCAAADSELGLCCRWVDEVVTDAPWVINQEFLDKHKIDFVTHDALPYSDASGQANDVYDFVRPFSSCCALSCGTLQLCKHCFGEGWLAEWA